MNTIVGWGHCCKAPSLRGYLTVVVSGQVVIFCNSCATSRWVPVTSVKLAKPAPQPS